MSQHTDVPDYKASEVKSHQAVDYDNSPRRRAATAKDPTSKILPCVSSYFVSHYRKALTLFTEARSSKTRYGRDLGGDV